MLVRATLDYPDAYVGFGHSAAQGYYVVIQESTARQIIDSAAAYTEYQNDAEWHAYVAEMRTAR